MRKTNVLTVRRQTLKLLDSRDLSAAIGGDGDDKEPTLQPGSKGRGECPRDPVASDPCKPDSGPHNKPTFLP